MAADWKLLYASLLDPSTVLGELPAEAFSYTEVLNGDGSWSATMPLVTTTPTRLTNEVTAPQLTETDILEGGTAVYFERDGVVLWGGIVWATNAQVETNTMTLSGAGFFSYFRHRFMRVTTTYTAQDQLVIARDLIDDAQAVANGSIGVLTSETFTSGVTRDRTYQGFERKNVAEALEQLSQVTNGFDFRFHSFRDGSGTITTEFRTTYPATGRRTEYVFELGVNIQLLSYRASGGNLTNTVDAIGAGDGDDLLIQTAQDPTGLASRPLLESVASHPEVSVSNTLLEHAKRAIVRGSAPVREVNVRVFPDEIPTLGSYIIGDQVYVKGSYGFIELGSWYRITSMAVSVSTDGAEEVSLTLVPLEVFDE